MAIKTQTVTVRMAPAVKNGLQKAADKEHRSLANMLEVMIRDYCTRNGVVIPEQVSLFSDKLTSKDVTS
ncbi:hypothetical protein [Desulfonatronum parangueonense]